METNKNVIQDLSFVFPFPMGIKLMEIIYQFKTKDIFFLTNFASPNILSELVGCKEHLLRSFSQGATFYALG